MIYNKYPKLLHKRKICTFSGPYIYLMSAILGLNAYHAQIIGTLDIICHYNVFGHSL